MKYDALWIPNDIGDSFSVILRKVLAIRSLFEELLVKTVASKCTWGYISSRIEILSVALHNFGWLLVTHLFRDYLWNADLKQLAWPIYGISWVFEVYDCVAMPLRIKIALYFALLLLLFCRELFLLLNLRLFLLFKGQVRLMFRKVMAMSMFRQLLLRLKSVWAPTALERAILRSLTSCHVLL